MSVKRTKLAVAAGVLAMSLTGISKAASIIEGGNSAVVGGWNVTVPTGLSVAVDSADNGVLMLEKTANFTSSAGLPITFQQVSASAVSQVEFQDEAITNNTGSDWSNFTFSLTSPATFAGVGNVFAPPVGTGVDFQSVTLDSAKQTLVYDGGTQKAGAISNWGDADPADGLLINAAPGATGAFTSFSFTESPSGGGGGSTVPVPAAAWQGLVGMAGLGLWFGSKRLLKHSHAI